MNKRHIGSDFDDFLRENGLLARCEAAALKRVIVWQRKRKLKPRRTNKANSYARQLTIPAL
jgi:hypothetical protein